MKGKIFILLITIFFVSSSFATNNKNNNDPTPWQFTATPYLWAIAMNGHVTAGTTSAHVNESFNQILDHLHGGYMIWFDLRKGRFDIFFNALFAVLDYNTGISTVSINAQNRFGLYSGGISYEVYKHLFSESQFFSVEPYGGFRYTTNDTTIRLNTSTIYLKVVDNQYWTDPIIGAKLNLQFAKAWGLIFAGDIGGINASSQYSYNVQAYLNYTKAFTYFTNSFYLGYRLLDQHYTDGSGASYYDWNMKLSGPVIGIGFTF